MMMPPLQLGNVDENRYRWYPSYTALRSTQPYQFRFVSSSEQSLALLTVLVGAASYAAVFEKMITMPHSHELSMTSMFILGIGALIGLAAQPAFRGKLYNNHASRAAYGAASALCLPLMVRLFTTEGVAASGVAPIVTVLMMAMLISHTWIGAREGDSHDNVDRSAREMQPRNRLP